MGAGKTVGTKRAKIDGIEEKRKAEADRRDYDPLQEAKHPSPPGRRKKAAKDRRKA